MNRRNYMRNALSVVLGLAFLPWTMAQEAASGGDLPSAESIFDRYVEVTGGAAAYESATSQVATGTMSIPAAGLTGKLEILTRPGLQLTSIDLPGVGLTKQGFKDGVAWVNSPVMGPIILDGAAAELMSIDARLDAPLHWADTFSSHETAGIEDVNGEPAYRVVLTLSTGDSIARFFGVESGLLLKHEYALPTPLGNIPTEVFAEEYMDFDGILAPSRLVTRQAGQQSVITITSSETNVEIPDERFDLPEAVQALLE